MDVGERRERHRQPRPLHIVVVYVPFLVFLLGISATRVHVHARTADGGLMQLLPPVCEHTQLTEVGYTIHFGAQREPFRGRAAGAQG